MILQGDREPGKIRSLLDRARFKVRRSLLKLVEVSDGQRQYRFHCEDCAEVYRVSTLLIKEEGTVRWIDESVNPGDVFYDIGANIGLYTVVAAARVLETGRVYSFEPHLPNAQRLLENIRLNGFESRTKVISSPLSDREGFEDFNYYDWTIGSSRSQLGKTLDEYGHPFNPVCRELKIVTTIDHLVSSGAIKPAAHVKIDVDGNELLILKGMQSLLKGSERPKSLQVEVNVNYGKELIPFMEVNGYYLVSKSFTLTGKRKISQGVDESELPYNAVFKPR